MNGYGITNTWRLFTGAGKGAAKSRQPAATNTRVFDGTCSLLAFLILFPSLCFAEVQKGLDILGLAKHDAGMIAQEADPHSAIGFLDVTFGDPYGKVQQLLDSGKVTAFRVHLWDHTCYRNRVCPSGVPRQTDVRTVTQRAQRLAAFVARNPGKLCLVSPALEHDVRDRKTVEAWFAELKKIVPQCIPVCSAFTGYCPSGVLIEKHGNKARGAIVSNDGETFADANREQYLKAGTHIVFAWDYCANGRTSGEKTFTAPLKRVDWCDRELIRHQVRWLRDPEPKPQASCKTPESPNLWKPLAEYYGAARKDARGNKSLFISKSRPSFWSLTGLRGQNVGSLKGGEAYSGNPPGWRFYVGNGSNQRPTQLMDQLKSEWALIRGGSECFLVNVLSRAGYFR